MIGIDWIVIADTRMENYLKFLDATKPMWLIIALQKD